jgi:hypothetical protein
VLAQIVTKDEVETKWTIKDLLDAHEALDIQEEAAEYIEKHPRSRS